MSHGLNVPAGPPSYRVIWSYFCLIKHCSAELLLPCTNRESRKAIHNRLRKRSYDLQTGRLAHLRIPPHCGGSRLPNIAVGVLRPLNLLHFGGLRRSNQLHPRAAAPSEPFCPGELEKGRYTYEYMRRVYVHGVHAQRSYTAYMCTAYIRSVLNDSHNCAVCIQ